MHFRPTRIRDINLHPGEPATPYDRLRGQQPRVPENPLWKAAEVTPNVFLINHPHYLPVVQWRESLPAVTNLMEIRARRQFPYRHDGPETIHAEARVVRSLKHARLWTLRVWENGLEVGGKQATYRSIDAATTAAIKWVSSLKRQLKAYA